MDGVDPTAPEITDTPDLAGELPESMSDIPEAAEEFPELVEPEKPADTPPDSLPDAPEESGEDEELTPNEENDEDTAVETGGKGSDPDDFHYFEELEANASYEFGGCTYETDDQGRVTTVSGRLHLGESERTSHQTEVGHQGLETDEGGHLIGARFGGSPEGFNIVPQDVNLNRGGWKEMENRWAEALDRGEEVEVVISVLYEQDTKRPMGFHVLDTINSESHERQFVNIPRGRLV